MPRTRNLVFALLLAGVFAPAFAQAPAPEAGSPATITWPPAKNPGYLTQRFTWKAWPGAQGYRIEISQQDNFATLVAAYNLGVVGDKFLDFWPGNYYVRLVGLFQDGAAWKVLGAGQPASINVSAAQTSWALELPEYPVLPATGPAVAPAEKPAPPATEQPTAANPASPATVPVEAAPAPVSAPPSEAPAAAAPADANPAPAAPAAPAAPSEGTAPAAAPGTPPPPQ